MEKPEIGDWVLWRSSAEHGGIVVGPGNKHAGANHVMVQTLWDEKPDKSAIGSTALGGIYAGTVMPWLVHKVVKGLGQPEPEPVDPELQRIQELLAGLRR